MSNLTDTGKSEVNGALGRESCGKRMKPSRTHKHTHMKKKTLKASHQRAYRGVVLPIKGKGLKKVGQE